jgi:hypothetical protein
MIAWAAVVESVTRFDLLTCAERPSMPIIQSNSGGSTGSSSSRRYHTSERLPHTEAPASIMWLGAALLSLLSCAFVIHALGRIER